MNKDIEWLTVLDVEKQTHIPNATIRRYIRNHGHHLNIKKKGKSYYIASESTQIMLNIRQLYEDGKSLEQVEDALIEAGIPVTITVTEDDKQMTVNVGEALQDMQKTMNEQTKIIQSLVEQIKKQQEYIEERDKRFISDIKENEESIKQVAAANHEEEKKGWFARLLGK